MTQTTQTTQANRLEVLTKKDGWVTISVGSNLVRMQELAATLPKRQAWRMVPVSSK